MYCCFECFYEIPYKTLYICIYSRLLFGTFSEHLFLEMTEMQHVFFCDSKLLVRPWDLSHRVERQKEMVNTWREMSVRVRKGGVMAHLLLR